MKQNPLVLIAEFVSCWFHLDVLQCSPDYSVSGHVRGAAHPGADPGFCSGGLSGVLTPEGALAQNLFKWGFSLQIAWNLHDFEKKKPCGQRGFLPEGPLDPLVTSMGRIWGIAPWRLGATSNSAKTDVLWWLSPQNKKDLLHLKKKTACPCETRRKWCSSKVKRRWNTMSRDHVIAVSPRWESMGSGTGLAGKLAPP